MKVSKVLNFFVQVGIKFLKACIHRQYKKSVTASHRQNTRSYEGKVAWVDMGRNLRNRLGYRFEQIIL